jgi:hypothetical protein
MKIGKRDMKKRIIMAILGLFFWGTVLIPAWAADPQKLPPDASVANKSKMVQPGAAKSIDTSQIPKPGCVPKTCEQVGAEVGDISDGCGHVVHCGIAQKVSITIDPPQYAGICPKTLKLTGTITAKKKGKAYYQWMGPTAPGNFQPLKNGTLVFEAAGSKQVFLDYSVPINLPADQQRVHFSADGAEGVTTFFKVVCTKVLKPGEGVSLDPKQ